MDDNTKNTSADSGESPEEVLDFTEEAAENTGEVLDFTEEAVENTGEVLDFTEEAAENTGEVLDFTEDTADGNEAAADEEKADGTAQDAPEAETSAETAAEEKEVTAPKKDPAKIIGRIAAWLVSAVLLIFVAGVTVYYITTASKAEFHADCTDTITWAEASVESGHLYNEDFTYACFLPFSTSTLMIPLIHIFGFGMTAHIVGMTCFFVLLTVFMILMMREITGSFPPAMAGTAIFLSITLATKKLREIFWGHTIYYSLGILFLVIGVYLFSRLITARSARKKPNKEKKSKVGIFIHTALIFIILSAFMFLTGMDGITGFTLFTLPFVGAIFAEYLVNPKHRLFSIRSLRVTFVSLFFLVMSILGNALNNELLDGMKAGYQDANSEFSDYNTWHGHLQGLPLAWMKLLGVQNLPDVMFTKEKGVKNIIFIAASILIAVLPIVATFCYKKYGTDKKGRLMRMWVWMHWAVTAVVMMGYVCGILSVADWRLTPVVGTSLILSISFVFWAVSRKADVARIAVILFIPVFAAGMISCDEVRKMKKDGYKQNTQYKLAEFLREQNLDRGYATFWNSHAITLLTDNKIRVYDINVSDSGAYVRGYQSSKKWYETDPEQEEYFILLTDYEFSQYSASDDYKNDPPKRLTDTVINNVGYNLLVYDHNMFGT